MHNDTKLLDRQAWANDADPHKSDEGLYCMHFRAKNTDPDQIALRKAAGSVSLQALLYAKTPLFEFKSNVSKV